MDYQKLTRYMDAFMAIVDVCAAKLRDWHEQGSDVSLVDIRRAYMQICIHGSLWPFQRVMV